MLINLRLRLTMFMYQCAFYDEHEETAYNPSREYFNIFVTFVLVYTNTFRTRSFTSHTKSQSVQMVLFMNTYRGLREALL